LFVLTVGVGAERSAALLSFVQQVGFDPPSLTIAVKKGRDHLLGLLRAERKFCLAVVPDDGRAMLGHFAAGFAPGVDPLAGIPHAISAHGVGYPTAACAHLECELVGEADWADHLLLCGRVVGGDARLEPRPWVHVRKNGLTY
jgi:flavin reductase (DIM6/NTAB) family NADH-FMN oxidoreductase RutF